MTFATTTPALIALNVMTVACGGSSVPNSKVAEQFKAQVGVQVQRAG